jgi:AcrR family transcriptional regulator
MTVMHPDTLSLTARRKLRTRQQLAEAAAELFYERGYDSTTVEDIAAAVDVSPRTVYRYFATKEDLIVALGETNSADFRAGLSARPASESPFEAVQGAVHAVLVPKWDPTWRVRAFLNLIRDTPVLRARWVQQAYDEQQKLAVVLAEREGRLPTLGDLVVAGAISMALNTGMLEWAAQSKIASPAVYVDRAIAHLALPLLSKDSAS